MSHSKLSNKTVAFLVTDGFEQVELTKSWDAVKAAGATVRLVSIHSGKVQGVHHDEKGEQFDVDSCVGDVSASDFDALVLPGGVFNPDALRVNDEAVDFVRDFFKQLKPVAAICHGPWTLIEAGAVRGRRVTSWPSLKTDLVNAGADWVNEQCVCDQGLVTSRNPDDLPAFCEKVIEEIAEGKHAQQTV
ncbi:Putative cysteine protease YraA [Roseimaritima multifibrata]|uniref:Cysteine protease YraA n=1 Tax=Roseimaritima multifibrata TaxID=1930274 RepID=A0A517MGK5_9BACT|nr:type 1 glutamine amidotransferase domain-containing protein [Roseimaritima multifibrata]QDS93897.1 Putative cysteine protease YraA [Roseimaritima multifibrata]